MHPNVHYIKDREGEGQRGTFFPPTNSIRYSRVFILSEQLRGFLPVIESLYKMEKSHNSQKDDRFWFAHNAVHSLSKLPPKAQLGEPR